MKLGDRVAPYRGTRFTEGLLYLRRRRLKVRIHGRPRSDRKKRFLLSAVAPSTITRHPREAKPINWAQRGGPASGSGNCVLTPRPHFTAPSRTLGNQVLVLRTALLFVRSAVRLVYAELPGPVAVCSPNQGQNASQPPYLILESVFAWTGIPANSRLH